MKSQLPITKMPNITEKFQLEPPDKPSKLFMTPVHPTYGSHQALASVFLAYHTPDSTHQDHQLMKRTEPLLISNMDLDPLKELVEVMLLKPVVFPLEQPSEKSPQKVEFHSSLLISMES